MSAREMIRAGVQAVFYCALAGMIVAGLRLLIVGLWGVAG